MIDKKEECLLYTQGKGNDNAKDDINSNGLL